MRTALALALAACVAGCAQAPSTTPTADAYIADQLKRDKFDRERLEIVGDDLNKSTKLLEEFNQELKTVVAAGKTTSPKLQEIQKQMDAITAETGRKMDALGKKYGVAP